MCNGVFGSILGESETMASCCTQYGFLFLAFHLSDQLQSLGVSCQ